MTAHWRAMRADDMPALLAVADCVHEAYPEDEAVLADKFRLYPEGCLMAERAGEVLGYIISHPWRFKSPPALNTRLGALPETPDTFYIHDIALLPKARGLGLARRVIAELEAQTHALALPSISLIAVHDSGKFWQGFGFEALEDAGLDTKLKSYDDAARYYVKWLTHS